MQLSAKLHAIGGETPCNWVLSSMLLKTKPYEGLSKQEKHIGLHTGLNLCNKAMFSLII